MSGSTPTPAAAPALRHVLTHLLTPLLMCLGMGLAYMGAFVQPEPHHLPVAVVGEGPKAMVFAQTVKNEAGDALDVRTLTDRTAAIDEVKDRRVTAAYVLSDTRPELIVATAASDTGATVAQKIFTPAAARQGAPLKVTDVVPTTADDPTGQGLFFLLVAISIGSYASVAVLGGAGAALRMRGRALLVVAVSGAVSVIGALLAGPVFHLAHHGLVGVWGLSWLYSARHPLHRRRSPHLPEALDDARHDGALRDAQLHQLRRAVPARAAERLLRLPERLLERRRPTSKACAASSTSATTAFPAS